MEQPLLRILDAAANRAREALRVLEDACRFSWNEAELTQQLKTLRHDLAAALETLPMDQALQARDTPGDVGTGIKTASEFCRDGLADILTANAKRLAEALRSLEEFAKIEWPKAAGRFEKLRYRAYGVEQALAAQLAQSNAAARFEKVRLYILLTESLCALPWKETLKEILGAGGDALCVQLREKSLEGGELLERARYIVEQCREVGAVSIINDRVDVAMASGADGVHLGQEDIPASAARKILPWNAIIGISTENLAQARQAVADGAAYVAVGPMFPTTTKEKPRIAGPAYAAAAVNEIRRPLVAIGGINAENLHLVLEAGIRRVAVSSAVLRAPRPGEVVSQLLSLIPPHIQG